MWAALTENHNMASTYISLPFNSLAVDALIIPAEPVQVAEGAVIAITGNNEFEYAEVLAVPSQTTATILSRNFTLPHKLRKVDATGNAIGTYSIRFNGEDIDKKRSTVTNFNCEFDYESGITIPANTVVSIVVTNGSSANAGDFAARLLFSQN